MPIIGITGSQNVKSFLNPNPPTIGTALDVGTSRAYDNGAIDVVFTASASGAPATSFEVYTSSSNVLVGTGSSSPIRITGLATGSSSSYYVKAINAVGPSASSSTSNSVTVTTVPGSPTSVSASKNTGSVGAIDYSFAAPSNNGGKSITGYNQTGIGNRTDSPGSYTITGLSQGTSYTVSVTATNGNGASAAATATATSSAYVCPQGGYASGSTCYVGANATTNYTCDCAGGYYQATNCRNGATQYVCGSSGIGYNASNQCGCCLDTGNKGYRSDCYAYSTQYSCSVGSLSGSQCYYSASIG
jgi:hypothetical protein